MVKLKVLTALETLVDIAATHPDVEALIGLGSIANPKRLDNFSDIDFFLIVSKGYKIKFLNDLTWLHRLLPVYQHQNTKDGFKILLQNDVFLEFAVFTLDELNSIPYHQPKILYAKSKAIETKIPMKLVPLEKPDQSYHLHEALSNLYIGLLRYKRGEKMAAYQMIQEYAFHHMVLAKQQIHGHVDMDPFNPFRRLEQADPNLASWSSTILIGIDQTLKSAERILNEIKKLLPTNNLMSAVERLL